MNVRYQEILKFLKNYLWKFLFIVKLKMKMSAISREVHQIKWNICHFVAKYMYFDIPKYLFP